MEDNNNSFSSPSSNTVSDAKQETNTSSKTEKTTAPSNSSAENKFLKDAEKQVNKIMKDMTSLSELSIKHKGSYTEEHIEQIFKALRKKIENTRKSFKMQDEDDDSFTFGD